MTAEQVLGYLQAAHQADQAEKLAALARRMLQASGHPGVMARQGLPDPTQQFLALQYALQQGQRDGAPPERLQALRDALADLDDDHGAEIRARLNTAAVIGGQATDAEAVGRLQATYEELVLGAPTLAKTLDLALARFGAQGYAGGLAMLVKALGADLAAARPSTSMVRLQTLLQDLYQLEVVQTVLDGAQGLARGLAQRHGHEGLDAEALVRELVSLTAERWVNGPRFDSLADALGVPDGPARIGLLTGLKTLLRELPPRVFADAEARQTVLDAVQSALDAAIAREEEDAR
jgi:type III secretion protein W